MQESAQKISSFEDLIAWQEGHRLVLRVYQATRCFPKAETYGLASQMQRAVVSVTSNIAEGFGRKSHLEKRRFYYMSAGSLSEIRNQLIISRDLGYVSQNEYDSLESQATKAYKVLNGLISSTV